MRHRLWLFHGLHGLRGGHRLHGLHGFHGLHGLWGRHRRQRHGLHGLHGHGRDAEHGHGHVRVVRDALRRTDVLEVHLDDRRLRHAQRQARHELLVHGVVRVRVSLVHERRAVLRAEQRANLRVVGVDVDMSVGVSVSLDGGCGEGDTVLNSSICTRVDAYSRLATEVMHSGGHPLRGVCGELVCIAGGVVWCAVCSVRCV